MEFVSPAQSIFAKNLKDISLATSLDTLITVGLSGGPLSREETLSFTLMPVDGVIVIKVSELARRLLSRYDATVDVIVPERPYDYVYVSTGFPTLTISASNSSGQCTWSTPVTVGGYGDNEITDEAAFFRHNFLTFRPQVATTAMGLKEELTLFNVEQVTRAITARLYFRKELPYEVVLVRAGTSPFMFRIDVSPAAIKAVADYYGYTDELVAYDIYGIEGGVTTPETDIPFAQRFVLKAPSLRHTSFFFQNSLGAFDTVTATGQRTSLSEGEASLFTSGRREYTLDTGLSESFEVNTGYIRSRAEKYLWDEFLLSPYRWLLLPDGTHREVVIDDFDASYTFSQLSSYTFTYRLSTPEPGHILPRTTLKDYIS